VINQFYIFLLVYHQANNNLALEIAGKMDPAGVGPATTRIQAPIQSGMILCQKSQWIRSAVSAMMMSQMMYVTTMNLFGQPWRTCGPYFSAEELLTVEG
jgi:hypothetical protein